MEHGTETTKLNLVYVRAVSVCRFTHVDARVFGVRVEYIQGDESEIVHWPETMSYMQQSCRFF